MLPQTQYPIFSMPDHGPAIIPTDSDPSLIGLGVNADFSWEYFSEGDVVETNNTVNLTIDVGLNETMVESGDKGFHLTTFVDVLPDKREGVVQKSYRLSTYAFEITAEDEGKPHVRFCEGAHGNPGAITPVGGGL